jgi:hypothetical protein
LDLSGREELSGVGAGIRPLSIYDQLGANHVCNQASEGACRELAEGMVLS